MSGQSDSPDAIAQREETQLDETIVCQSPHSIKFADTFMISTSRSQLSHVNSEASQRISSSGLKRSLCGLLEIDR
jgi:hypothetical protein